MSEKERDGGWGWLVLFFVLCCQTILGGICYSGGLFYIIFMDVFNSDPVETAWLCSLPMALWYFASPVGSYLVNRYGCRTSAFIGGILATVGLTLDYFANSIRYLFFFHGFLTGLGLGINYTSCMAVLNIYFDRFKTLASGLAAIGHNAGLVIYAKFIIYLEKSYGWRGMMLILGAIAFNLCACATAMFPLKTRNSLKSENLEISKKHKRTINVTLFKKPTFIMFCASNVFINTSLGIYIVHIPSYLKEVGYTEENVGTALMVYGISNIIGKVIYSFLGNHPAIDEISLYTVSLTATGIATFLTPIFLTKAGVLIIAGVTGAFSSVTGALLQAVIYKIVGFERFADGAGLSLPFKATGNLIGGPLAGFVFDTTDNYAYSFYLSGICMVIASLFMIQPMLHHICKRKQLQNKSLSSVLETNFDGVTTAADKGTTYQHIISNKSNRKGTVALIENANDFEKTPEETGRFLDTDT